MTENNGHGKVYTTPTGYGAIRIEDKKGMTPDELRALADKSVQRDDQYAYVLNAKDLIEYNAALRSAAEQIETVQGENRALRETVEGAPHGWHCAQFGMRHPDHRGFCDCWKADALTKNGETE